MAILIIRVDDPILQWTTYHLVIFNTNWYNESCIEYSLHSNKCFELSASENGWCIVFTMDFFTDPLSLRKDLPSVVKTG